MYPRRSIEAHRPSDPRIGERRAFEVDQDIVINILAGFENHHAGNRLFELLGCGPGPLLRHDYVEAAGLEGSDPRPALFDHDEPDPVEVGSTLDEVVGVAHHLDQFTGTVLFELERPGPDAPGAQLGRRNVSWIDRRVSRREQQQEGRLGPL